jgi:hypothetical protein
MPSLAVPSLAVPSLEIPSLATPFLVGRRMERSLRIGWRIFLLDGAWHIGMLVGLRSLCSAIPLVEFPMRFVANLCTAAVTATVLTATASAEVVVGWTIPSAFPTNPPPSGTSYSVGAADQGANAVGSSLGSSHVAAATAYTSPAGNGSQYAFSSNNWAIGDYYEASFSTAGFTDISISWDQARSSTGPVEWELLVSSDGGLNFTSIISYTVLQSGGGSAPGTWSVATYNPIYTQSLTLADSTWDQGNIVVRFRALTAAGGVSGSSRIDNIFVNGAAVPAPGALAMLGAAGAIGMRRRRR